MKEFEVLCVTMNQKDFSKIPTSCTREQFNEAREIYKKRILDFRLLLYSLITYLIFALPPDQ